MAKEKIYHAYATCIRQLPVPNTLTHTFSNRPDKVWWQKFLIFQASDEGDEKI